MEEPENPYYKRVGQFNLFIMSNLIAQLGSGDLGNIITGPIQAAVQAQHAASMSQIQFIQEVGFKPGVNGGPAELRYVDFKYQKSVPNGNGNGFIKKEVELKVPFLTMLTIPALRIDEMTIDFNAKITSTETSNVSSNFAASASLGINYKVVKFKASASYKRSSSRGVKIEKAYNLGVHVKVLNEGISPGMERIFSAMEDSIESINGSAGSGSN